MDKKGTCLPFGPQDVSNLRELHLDFPVPQDGNFPDPQMKSTKMLDVMFKKQHFKCFLARKEGIFRGRNLEKFVKYHLSP